MTYICNFTVPHPSCNICRDKGSDAVCCGQQDCHGYEKDCDCDDCFERNNLDFALGELKRGSQLSTIFKLDGRE